MNTENVDSGADKRALISHGAIIGVTVTNITLITSAVMARIYTRFRIHRKLWWDDCTEKPP